MGVGVGVKQISPQIKENHTVFIYLLLPYESCFALMSELNMPGNNSKFLQWFLQWLQKVLCDAATRCPHKSSIYKITNSKNDVLNDGLKKCNLSKLRDATTQFVSQK